MKFPELGSRRRNGVQMVDIGLNFMRNTDRIVSIKFYVSLLETRDNM